MNGRIPPLRGVGSTTPTRRTRRTAPPVPEFSPSEVARDAMAEATQSRGGKVQVSAGAVHYSLGVMRVDFTMGLVGSGAQLERDLRAVEALVRAGLAALETRP